MTKTFCDKCSKEIIDNNSIRVSFHGSTSKEKSVWKNMYFCEGCYIKVDKKVKSIFQIKDLEKTRG